MEHSAVEASATLGKQFGLSDAEMKEMLPSGRQRRFLNRVGWARTYLKMAGLLQYVRRGAFKITDKGLDVLRSNLDRIDVSYLKQFPEFTTAHASVKQSESSISTAESKTPEETFEEVHQRLREELAEQILERIRECPPAFFESLVVDLLVAMGYGGSRKDAGQAVGRTGDEGVDGLIKEDKLGLDTIYIQAKRWQNTVGRPDIQLFSGSLDGFKAKKGVFITTSQFTQTAVEYVKHIEKKIILIDGKMLAELMIDHGIGVTEVVTYRVCRVDEDYFTEG